MFWGARFWSRWPFSGSIDREAILSRLRQNEPKLRAKGVAHVALFGSRARGDERPDSDTDILVEFDPGVHITVFDYAVLKEFITNLLDGPVDVVSREGLEQRLRPRTTAEAIYAF